MNRIFLVCISLLVASFFACSYVTDAERKESWAQIEAGATVIDVRSEQEYAEGRFDGALHMPYQTIATVLPQQIPDKETPIVVYCTVGGRSGIAQKSLRELGYTRVYNAGGLSDLQKAAASSP